MYDFIPWTQPDFTYLRGGSMNSKLKELTVDERVKLVEDLWDSIAADQNALPLTDEQKAELDRRLDAYELDKNPGRPVADAVADIRRRL
jgi:putative addiction module component (TIGR02574 family)